MKPIEYSREHARQALDKWRTKKELPALNVDYSLMRTELVQFYNKAKNDASKDDRKEYMTDVFFGLALYGYLRNQPWFNLRTAANDGFWRYVAVSVIPDIVADRWGISKDQYFWKQSNRLWPKTAWWFIYLTWHETLQDTAEMLASKNFNSDTIQGIVERTGRKGTFVDVYREIIFQYSELDYNVIATFKKHQFSGSDSLFRAIMRLNTARGLVTDPCLSEDGVKGYVSSMLSDLNVKY